MKSTWSLAEPSGSRSLAESESPAFASPRGTVRVVLREGQAVELCAADVSWTGPRDRATSISVLGCEGSRAQTADSLEQLLDSQTGSLKHLRESGKAFADRLRRGLLDTDREVIVGFVDGVQRMSLTVRQIDSIRDQWFIRFAVE